MRKLIIHRYGRHGLINIDIRITKEPFLQFNITRKIWITCGMWFNLDSESADKYISEDGYRVYPIHWLWFSGWISWYGKNGF